MVEMLGRKLLLVRISFGSCMLFFFFMLYIQRLFHIVHSCRNSKRKWSLISNHTLIVEFRGYYLNRVSLHIIMIKYYGYKELVRTIFFSQKIVITTTDPGGLVMIVTFNKTRKYTNGSTTKNKRYDFTKLNSSCCDQ